MTTLKEAHMRAIDAVWANASALAPFSEVIALYLDALDTAGFVIVPKEATEEMNQLGMKSIADAMDEGFMLTPGEVFTKMLAARQKVDDEG